MPRKKEQKAELTEIDFDRFIITTKPDLALIGQRSLEALTYLDDGELGAVRDLVIEIQREIYPYLWQPIGGQP